MLMHELRPVMFYHVNIMKHIDFLHLGSYSLIASCAYCSQNYNNLTPTCRPTVFPRMPCFFILFVHIIPKKIRCLHIISSNVQSFSEYKSYNINIIISFCMLFQKYKYIFWKFVLNLLNTLKREVNQTQTSHYWNECGEQLRLFDEKLWISFWHQYYFTIKILVLIFFSFSWVFLYSIISNLYFLF